MPWLQMFIGIWVLILGSQLSFDVFGDDIPVTGQTLALSLVVYFIKRHWNLVVIIIYLGAGILNNPVFADGKGGYQMLTGKTGGYLYGFLIVAFLVNILHDGLKLNRLHRGIYLTLLTLYVLLCGVFHLSVVLHYQNAFAVGFIPYLPGAAVKIAMAWMIIEAYEITRNR